MVHYSMCDLLESYYQGGGPRRAATAQVRGPTPRCSWLRTTKRPHCAAFRTGVSAGKGQDICESVCSRLQVGGRRRGRSVVPVQHPRLWVRPRTLYSGTVPSAPKLLQQNGYMTPHRRAGQPRVVIFCVSRDESGCKPACARRTRPPPSAPLLRPSHNGVFTEFRPSTRAELAMVTPSSGSKNR